MTRINVVPVDELCNQHLFAEWREMPRLVMNLNKSLNRKSKAFSSSEISKEYTLNKGHIKFFYDKFEFLHKRHQKITERLLEKGYNLSIVNSDIFATVPKEWYNDYEPTEEALRINRERIQMMMPPKPRWGNRVKEK